MKQYTQAELDKKIHTFLDEKMSKFQELQKKNVNYRKYQRADRERTSFTSGFISLRKHYV